MIWMAEKKSHLPGETAFGGAIPDPIKREFDRLVKRAGWKRKRAIAAAISALLRASETAPEVEGSEAARVYASVSGYYADEEEVVNPEPLPTTNSQGPGAHKILGAVLDSIGDGESGGKPAQKPSSPGKGDGKSKR